MPGPYTATRKNENMNIIEITDLSAPELAPYTRLTEAQLRNKLEPEKGIFIAESPKVIGTALDAGCEPLSFLMERRQIDGPAAGVLARCPDATVYGQAVLDNYDLRFRGSGVATVEPKEGACVYGLLWELTDKCEASLDRYEGYPRLYIKQTLEVRTFDGQRVPVMAYIMNPELHLKPSLPPRDYYLGIKAGYEQNGLPVGCLKYAFKNCLKECGIEPYPKKVQTKPPQRKEASHER